MACMAWKLRWKHPHAPALRGTISAGSSWAAAEWPRMSAPSAISSLGMNLSCEGTHLGSWLVIVYVYILILYSIVCVLRLSIRTYYIHNISYTHNMIIQYHTYVSVYTVYTYVHRICNMYTHSWSFMHLGLMASAPRWEPKSSSETSQSFGQQSMDVHG